MMLLKQWLTHIEEQHPADIELGLDRVKQVAAQANLLPFKETVITVAGTNGKGSVVKALESSLIAMGYRVCSYTSPHLFIFNERIRVNGTIAADATLVECFEEVEEYRLAAGAPPLTYFEFGTLVALFLFKQEKPDVILLEVGLGGRLDAVNIVDPSIAVITTIDYDHQDWLGDTLEKIGAEKAGILRSKIPVVVGQNPIASTVLAQYRRLSCPAYQIDVAFSAQYQPDDPTDNLKESVAKNVVANAKQTSENSSAVSVSGSTQFSWQQAAGNKTFLAVKGRPKLTLESWATALQVLQILQDESLLEPNKLSEEDAQKVIAHTALTGRFSQHAGFDRTYFDVAHNAQAAQLLRLRLQAIQSENVRVHALFGVLADKDVDAMVSPLAGIVDNWWLADLSGVAGGLSAAELEARMPSEAKLAESALSRPGELWEHLNHLADEKDVIIVFGSFHTVAGVLSLKGVM